MKGRWQLFTSYYLNVIIEIVYFNETRAGPPLTTASHVKPQLFY